jgi:ABC-type uncharacterized transport system permease subunit
MKQSRILKIRKMNNHLYSSEGMMDMSNNSYAFYLTPEKLKSFTGDKDEVVDIAIGRVSYNDLVEQVLIFDYYTQKKKGISVVGLKKIEALGLSYSGKSLWVRSKDHVSLFDVHSTDLIFQTERHEDQEVLFSFNGDYFLVNDNNEVSVFDIENRVPILNYRFFEGEAQNIEFSLDSKALKWKNSQGAQTHFPIKAYSDLLLQKYYEELDMPIIAEAAKEQVQIE